jgi:4,5-DOPA dioxygenase extradiol
MTTPSCQPVLFLAHGNPMNALDRNRFTQAWSDMGRRAGRPRAILMISAHWYTRGLAVQGMPSPRTIHDFGAFPQALFDVRYPAPGDPALAERVKDLLSPYWTVAIDDRQWGLDHGAWSVLVHAYPEADIPVVQLSIDGTQPLSYHREVGQRLQALREEGVLIIGSGNVVHNLPRMDWGQPDIAYDWAQRFQDRVQSAITQHEEVVLDNYPALGPDAERSIPTPDHYLPLLYVLGARRDDDEVVFETPELVHGSLSMMSFGLWPKPQQPQAAAA